MSAVCVLAPIVISAWPGFSAAVTAAATTMGYVVADEAAGALMNSTSAVCRQAAAVDLEIPNSQIVTGQLGRDQHISVTKDGVTVTFSRDERGKAGLCVRGNGEQSQEELRLAGEELSRRVVQQYVYQRLAQEVQSRGYMVVEESRDANQAIHMRIRHWEN